MFKGINVVSIPVPDLDEARHFYRDILGVTDKGSGMTIDLMSKACIIRVIICRIRKEGYAVVVTGNEVRKGVMEFQRGVPTIAGIFKSHTLNNCQYSCPTPIFSLRS